jgi:acetylglutamate kinase
MKLIAATSLILTSILSPTSAFTPTLSTHRHVAPTTTLYAENPTFVANAKTIASSVSTLAGQTIVVKYGGNAMTTPELAYGFCEDIATLQKLGLRIVVVHGGGPMINKMLEKVGVESRFEGGMRVSTKEVVEVAAMVLCGDVNKNIAGGVVLAGGRALGLSGRDDGLLQCTKLWGGDDGKLDLGNVGQVKVVNTELINDLLDAGITPVIAPIGMGVKGAEDDSVVYNINADVAAGRIAGELKAARVLFLTDIAGVLDKEMKLLERLSCDDIDGLIKDETITGGMIPKGEDDCFKNDHLIFDTNIFCQCIQSHMPQMQSSWVFREHSSQMDVCRMHC